MTPEQNPSQRLQDEKIEHLKRLERRLVEIKLIKQVVTTKGWKEKVQPILDKMIRDIIGGKLDENLWDAGGLKSFTDKSPDFYMGYRQALIDFNNRLWVAVRSEKKYTEALNAMKQNPDSIYKTAMEQSPYYPMPKDKE